MKEKELGKASLALVLSLSLVITTGLFYITTSVAQAGALTSISDTLNNSAPSATSTHTIVFTLATAISADDSTSTITFPGGFTMGSVGEDDIDISGDTTGEMTTAADCTGAEEVGVSVSGQVVTFQFCNGDGGNLLLGEVVTVEIGDNATASGTGTNNIANPSKSAAVGTADIYTISVATPSDSGDALVAVIEGVTVSVTINESLSFSIAPVASSTCSGDSGTPTATGTATTSLTFPTPTANTFYVGCHDLTVNTNASSGYALTAETDTSLQTGAAVNIDSGTCDGACTTSATSTWATNTNNGFGYACENATGTPCSTAGTFTNNYRIFACTGVDANCDPGTGGESAVNIMEAAAPVSNDVGRIHYKLSVSGTQAAGAYSTTVTYIATPTF